MPLTDLRSWTREQLTAAGLVPNPHMWIGSGWLYCAACSLYRHHEAWSHKGTPDCFEVCKSCGCYSGFVSPEVTPLKVARQTGTALEPKAVRVSSTARYCYACDKFMAARVCKACGLPTEKMPKPGEGE